MEFTFPNHLNAKYEFVGSMAFIIVSTEIIHMSFLGDAFACGVAIGSIIFYAQEVALKLCTMYVNENFKFK